jgi:hypothetical protein
MEGRAVSDSRRELEPTECHDLASKGLCDVSSESTSKHGPCVQHVEPNIFTSCQSTLVGDWIGGENSYFRSLYRASMDGWDPRDFHRLCDNQGPTVVVVRLPDGSLFGGYADKSWQSPERIVNVTSSRAFLFVLQAGSEPTTIMVPISPDAHATALLHGARRGPGFGAYCADLKLLNPWLESANGSCSPSAQTYPGFKRSMAGVLPSKHFTPSELEVFAVL